MFRLSVYRGPRLLSAEAVRVQNPGKGYGVAPSQCRSRRRALMAVEQAKRHGPMELEIAPEKVAHVIIKAREYDVKVGSWSQVPRRRRQRGAGVRSSKIGAATTRRARELAGFIDALNDDEQAHLVALVWIGRGTFEPEELDEAVETAKAERTTATSRYLLGIPLLADYLEEGLEKLGYSVEDVENDVM